MPKITERLQHAWNAFRGRDRPEWADLGPASYYRPDRKRLRIGSDRSIVTAIYNRIAIDVAAVSMYHARLDQNGRYVETIHSKLNNCLTVEANIDQTGRQFIQDLVMSMFDEGVVASVPTDSPTNPTISSAFDVESIRTGKIVQWYPKHVRVEVYNENSGRKEERTFPKSMIGIHENPLFSIMNEPNSTTQRLIRKLALLDSVDEATSSGKLDLIIQLPFTLKNDLRKNEAERRRQVLEEQLKGSKLGVGYIDATEKVTQLNRPLENNLLEQIEYLTNQLYSQLGITPEILNGTADEKTMLNYYNRTIEPILSCVTDEFKRKFLTKTARTQGQSIVFIRDPFKLAPISSIAEIADKFTRNEILSSNEIRAIVGFKPVDDLRADELRNKNLNETPEQMGLAPVANDENQNGIELPIELGFDLPDNIAAMPIDEFNRVISQSMTGG